MTIQVHTSWPWIALLLGVAAALNSVGLDFLHSAFMSNEQMSRNIARPLVFMVGGVLGALALVEFGIRKLLKSRQRRLAGGVEHG